MSGRGRGKIKPPRRGLVTDQVDFDETWATLSQSLREIHSKNASALSFESLYRNAYKLVLKKFGDRLYSEVRDLVAAHLEKVAKDEVRPMVPSAVVTADTPFGNTAAVEKRIGGTRFLEQLQYVWQDHQLCMGMITDVMMYMNRIYCQDHELPTSYAVGMDLFRKYVLRNEDYKIDGVLNNVILGQIKMEREGDVIDHGPIRACIHMLESLYESLNELEEERVYLTSFEGPFLSHSEEFYEQEAQRLLRECDAATYLRKTQQRLEQERERCIKSISSLTQRKIEKVVDAHLIANNIRAVLEMPSGMDFMLNNDKIEDIKLLYKLVSRVDDEKKVIKNMITARIIEQGKAINQAVQNPPPPPPPPADSGPSTSAAAVKEGEKQVNGATASAIKWVDDVLAHKDKYDRIWEEGLNGDQGIQTTITRAFTEYINDLKEAPEYISLFIDDNLRRGIKGHTEHEVDVILDKAVTLFRYLSDKDVFERHYKNHLSRRLLMNRSLSHDAEKQMIGKLKMEVGVAFTSKLEGMFKDMDASQELTSEFKHGAGAENGIDLSMSVLTTTYWPSKVVGNENIKTCIYPAQVESLRQSFTEYYLRRHNGRKLEWKPNMGTADLKATFKGKKHEINVSTYGMVILLAFNDLGPNESLSFTDLKTITSISDDDLIRNLLPLCIPPKTRLLAKKPMSKTIEPTDRFTINDNFSSKYTRFKVGTVAGSKAETEKEKKETNDAVEKDRGIQIEACIVRIMKQRKQLSHQELMIEVVDQLKSRFQPDVGSVKKRIETLIDREYLERVEEKRETYKYLA